MPNEFQLIMKKNAAIAALKYIEDYTTIGIGTGSTVNAFIEQLAISNLAIKVIASSQATEILLKKYHIPTITFDQITDLPIYIDGTDAYNQLKQLIKGQGGALTKEKILAYASQKFICLADPTKERFNTTPIAIEVIPMARSCIARAIIKLGGNPVYRDGFVTDNGNSILDLYNLPIHNPISLEERLNNIPGIVANGIFAVRPVDLIIVGTEQDHFVI